MVRPKRAPNNIKKALNVGSQSNTTAELNLNDEDSLKKSNRTQKSDDDDDSKVKQTRRPTKQATAEPTKEPRKRRMASLNAEYLVHYCTNTNNPSQAAAGDKRSSAQSPSSSKRRRTVSTEAKKPVVRNRRKKADSDEEQEPVKARKSQKRRGRHKATNRNGHDDDEDQSDSSVCRVEAPIVSGRPKREASLRASAMIIQTNEIEKTRFQYYPATTSGGNAASAVPNTPGPAKPSTRADKSQFQVPNPPRVLKNAKNKSETNLKHVSTTTTLANSQTANIGRNESPDDEESSSDVLIVSEKNAEFLLTEERLAEHNKLYGSYSTGNGTFSTHTKDYINKWIGGLELIEDKPFPQEIIPIDSFGAKVLNDPQYLTVKSRQQPQSAQTAKATKVAPAVTAQTKAKEPTQPAKSVQTNQATKSDQKQNDLDPKPDQTTLNSASTNRLQTQFPFQFPFDNSTPSSAWSYPPTAVRPKSPPFRPEHVTWTNIQSGSESVNQLIAAAVGCSLSNPIGFFNSQGLTKSMSLPAHSFSVINQKYPQKPSFMMPSGVDSSNQPKIYLPSTDYFQDSSYLIPSYAKLKLKSEKLMDMRSHQHAAAAAAAAAAAIHQMPPMINVENVNFYGTLDEQQKAAAACFLQHQQDPCCASNSTSANQATTAAAAAAAAVAMNIAKLLTNKNEDKTETKLEAKNEPECESVRAAKKFLDTESVVSVSSSSSDIKLIKSECSQVVKQEPVQVKDEVCQEEKMQQDEEIEDKKSVCSSLSSSVHLIVDETSMIVNENLESQMNIDSEEMALNDKTDSNSNTNMNVDSINVNLPLESNSNMLESESTMDCRPSDKNDNMWILNSEPLDDKTYSSIRNKASNLVVNVNDCVLVEKENSELVNESSNTNYSYDENDCPSAKRNESFAQIKSIQLDASREKILIHVKMFYKPDQIKNEIKNLNDSIEFEENELISSQEACEQEVLEPEHIKSKSILSDHTNYLKMKENVTNASKSCAEGKIYFYRYDYDLNKKEINLIVEK